MQQKKETLAISHPQITDQAATIDAVLRFSIRCMHILVVFFFVHDSLSSGSVI